VTTSNSYIIIVKDKEKKKRQESISVACPLSKSRGVRQRKGEEVKLRKSELESKLKIESLHRLPVVPDSVNVK